MMESFKEYSLGVLLGIVSVIIFLPAILFVNWLVVKFIM